jgi:hypothetical protein
MRTWILIAGLVAAAAAVFLVLRRRASMLEEDDVDWDEPEAIPAQSRPVAEAEITQEQAAEEEASATSVS